MSSVSNIIAGGLIGLGVACGGFLAGESLVKSRLGFRTVTVKGLSEREVVECVVRGGPAAVHAYHGRDHLVDIRDARRDLGFQPRPLARGIVETFGPDGQGGRHAPGC